MTDRRAEKTRLTNAEDILKGHNVLDYTEPCWNLAHIVVPERYRVIPTFRLYCSEKKSIMCIRASLQGKPMTVSAAAPAIVPACSASEAGADEESFPHACFSSLRDFYEVSA